ncbi:MAG: hypothetical protein NUV65_05720 [Candidatus Roizmanbacteria bacterium]|nr:hypothetical protein [Candidatus Roizmanbacteria bacterium]
MAKKINITLSEVAKKHIKVVSYLMVSAALAYVLAVLTGRPESVYLTPIINYLLFAIKQELNKEGVIQAVRK